MMVSVANGQKLESKALSKPLVWQIQNLEFQFKLRSLKLGDNDIGIRDRFAQPIWTSTFDFAQGFIRFKNGDVVELTNRDSRSRIQMIEERHMSRWLNQQEYGLMGTILCNI
ncbi:Uncharacterized protein Adt_42008 [Abeliophyllum distichum]|uniref:Uncharacterized protein n=1 Tax=Abeliophyllum distichum TaxID=126358 RepID=A0ABD1PQH9_9LAMI